MNSSDVVATGCRADVTRRNVQLKSYPLALHVDERFTAFVLMKPGG